MFGLYEKVPLSAKISCKYCEQIKAQDSKEAESISEEEWKQATKFSVMFSEVAKLLDKSADVEELKKFLKFFCHPQTCQRYVDIKIYEHCSTPAEIVEALFPRYIHYMHTDFLRQILKQFGNEQSRILLRQYEENFPRKQPLKRMCNPLSDEQINSFTEMKRIKIKIDGDANVDTTTMEDVEKVQQTISESTGIDKNMVVYAKQTPGCVIFTFLIPETLVSCLSDLDEDSQKDLADHGILSVEVNDEVILPKGQSPSKPCPDPRESHQLSREFAVMFADVVDHLDGSVDVARLKDFLDSYFHPLYPEQPYFDLKVYKGARTSKQLMKSLLHQFINFMHYYLLEDIVERFGCNVAKEILQQFTNQSYDPKREIKDQPDPITDSEIEQFHGTEKLKVQVKGNAIVEIIEKVQKALEKASGVKQAVITYAFYDPDCILTFLIPECILHIFHELNTEDLTILADTGVMSLECKQMVIENIQQHCTGKVDAHDSGVLTKPTGLEYYLQQRAADMTSERCSHLLKMLGSVECEMLNDVCSEEFLRTFAKDLQDCKKLTPYFYIHEWNIEELVYNYPDENDQKYQVLMCWKKAEGSTATYYNLLESLIFHGNIGEVEALLQRLGESKWPCEIRCTIIFVYSVCAPIYYFNASFRASGTPCQQVAEAAVPGL